MNLESSQVQASIDVREGNDPDCLPILREYETFELKGIDTGRLGSFTEFTCPKCHIPKELGSCAINEKLVALQKSAEEAQVGMTVRDRSVQPMRTNYHNSTSKPSLGGTNRGMR